VQPFPPKCFRKSSQRVVGHAQCHAWIADGNCDPGIPASPPSAANRCAVRVSARTHDRPCASLMAGDVRAEVRLRTMAQNSRLMCGRSRRCSCVNLRRLDLLMTWRPSVIKLILSRNSRSLCRITLKPVLVSTTVDVRIGDVPRSPRDLVLAMKSLTFGLRTPGHHPSTSPNWIEMSGSLRREVFDRRDPSRDRRQVTEKKLRIVIQKHEAHVMDRCQP